MIGAEALLRWRHRELGAVSPAEFIPIAEASGLILPMGEWLLREAVQQLRRWVDAGMTEARLAPELLELQLTEGVAMVNPPAAIAVMDDMYERGVCLSIDDLGTGCSSLSCLKKFRVYKLKIDQSFVRDISEDPEDTGIVSAVISMAASLGLRTIAEGVETQGQLDFLRERGCDEVQGCFFSPALPAAAFTDFVSRAGSA